jgi:hypothetical protein
MDYGLLGVRSLQFQVSLNRNQAVDWSAWKEATRGTLELVLFPDEQLCHPAVALAGEVWHLTSSDVLVARLSARNEATVRFPDV